MPWILKTVLVDYPEDPFCIPDGRNQTAMEEPHARVLNVTAVVCVRLNLTLCPLLIHAFRDQKRVCVWGGGTR